MLFILCGLYLYSWARVPSFILIKVDAFMALKIWPVAHSNTLPVLGSPCIIYLYVIHVAPPAHRRLLLSCCVPALCQCLLCSAYATHRRCDSVFCVAPTRHERAGVCYVFALPAAMSSVCCMRAYATRTRARLHSLACRRVCL